MRAHLSLLLASAAAFAPPRTTHRCPALFADLAAATEEAVKLCVKEGAPPVPEERRLDFAGAADAETVRTNFQALAATVGDVDSALRMVKNNKMVTSLNPERVQAGFDAWVEKCESRDEALELVSRNPGLFFVQPGDIKDAPLGQCKAIAGAMELFRFGK
jgi:hypothetical protein